MYDDNDAQLHVVEREGVLYFNGRTAEERLAELDGPGDVTISSVGRRGRGIERRGRREGPWRYSIDDEERFTARGHNSVPVVRALREALGLGLSEAKMALDRACTRAKRR